MNPDHTYDTIDAERRAHAIALAASEARVRELREALETLYQHHRCAPEVRALHKNELILGVITKVLDAPSSDSALRRVCEQVAELAGKMLSATGRWTAEHPFGDETANVVTPASVVSRVLGDPDAKEGT